MSERVKIVTKEGTLSYPHLDKPYEDSGKYEAVIIFDPGEDLSELQAAVAACFKERWPKKVPSGEHQPIHPNEDRDGAEGYEEGGFYIRAKSKSRPKLFARDKSPASAEDFYPGCRVRLSVSPFAFPKEGQKSQGTHGVSFGLNAVQFIGDGDMIGGGGSDGSELDALDEADEDSAF